MSTVVCSISDYAYASVVIEYLTNIYVCNVGYVLVAGQGRKYIWVDDICPYLALAEIDHIVDIIHIELQNKKL